jgi:hypothetical protein
MKQYVRKDTTKNITRKRSLFVLTLLFPVLILLLSACIKEDYPVRLVFPVISTSTATNITTTSVTSGGDVTSDGGSQVSARGVCWSELINPSLAQPDSVTVDGNGTGQFTSTINGLLPDTQYHIRAYATNGEGTAYGQDIVFTTAAE